MSNSPWAEENLSPETCSQGRELLQLLTAEIRTLYHVSGGRVNSVIQAPTQEALRILDVLGQLFATHILEEVSEDDDYRPDRYCSSSPAETVFS